MMSILEDKNLLETKVLANQSRDKELKVEQIQIILRFQNL